MNKPVLSVIGETKLELGSGGDSHGGGRHRVPPVAPTRAFRRQAP